MPFARRRTAVGAFVTALLCGLGATMPVLSDGDSRIEDSRHYADRLQAELGARLKEALEGGGPVHAIEVCQMEAPAIADSLVEPDGPARVGRTALRVRNPANAPDAEASAVLEHFELLMAQGTGLPLSEFTVRPDGSARYMQAIVTQPLCLACHGTDIAPDVGAAISQRYPSDAATGFRVGELRGAFIVDWPAARQDTD